MRYETIIKGYIIVLSTEYFQHKNKPCIFISRNMLYESNMLWRTVVYDTLLKALCDYNFICDTLKNFHGRKFIRYISRSLWREYNIERRHGKI